MITQSDILKAIHFHNSRDASIKFWNYAVQDSTRNEALRLFDMISKDGQFIDCDCFVDMDGIVCFEFQIPNENRIELSVDGTGVIFIIENGERGGDYLRFASIELFAKIMKGLIK